MTGLDSNKRPADCIALAACRARWHTDGGFIIDNARIAAARPDLAAKESVPTSLTFDWPQSASSLLSQAKQEGELVKLILAGNSHLESWLIENRILPALQKKGLQMLRFTLSGQGKRSASIVPLPDGSAFALSASGWWSALECHEALHEIHHIGARFAPSDRWLDGFEATLQQADNTWRSVTPSEVALFWEAVTGSRPAGFAVGVLDGIEAFGLDMIDKIFVTQGRLGL